MTAPVVIVTGANAGIGFAASKQLAARGAEVVMACRSMERGAAAQAAIAEAVPGAALHLMALDVGSLASVRAFASAVRARFERVDALINNAAIFDITQKEPMPTADGIERVWATNFVGPALLTDLLLPALRGTDGARRGRVLDVSSKGLLAFPFMNVDIERSASGARFSATRAYYQSKLAMLTHTLHLARTEPSIVAHALWVPAVKVAMDRVPPLPPVKRWVYMMKRKAALEPAAMAEAYVAVALDAPWGTVSGRLVDHTLAEVRPPKRALRADVAEQLAAHVEACGAG